MHAAEATAVRILPYQFSDVQKNQNKDASHMSRDRNQGLYGLCRTDIIHRHGKRIRAKRKQLASRFLVLLDLVWTLVIIVGYRSLLRNCGGAVVTE